MQAEVSLHPDPRISAFDTGIAGQTYLFQLEFFFLRQSQALVLISVPKARRMQYGERSGIVMSVLTLTAELVHKTNGFLTEVE